MKHEGKLLVHVARTLEGWPAPRARGALIVGRRSGHTDRSGERTTPAASKTARGGLFEKHVAVRLGDELVAEVDALIPALSTAWSRAKRSDALRHVILEGLASIERKRRAQGGGR